MLEGHGDDLHGVKGKIRYNFSSNVYYKGPDSRLLNFLSGEMKAIENYPSPSADELNPLAADKYGLHPRQFLFTNGATEAFYLLARAFQNQTAAIVSPSFAEYEDACKFSNIDISHVKRDEAGNRKTDLMFLCNPNNPDGKVFSAEFLQSLIERNPGTHFVIDEAYMEFTLSTQSVMTLTGTYENLSVVRSLTKTFAIPGLRLGYIVSGQKTISKLMGFKMPWSVNALAIKAGRFIFEHYDQLYFSPEGLLQETSQFMQQLAEVEWLSPIPSETSYFLVKLHKGKAAGLKKHLIEQYGILIRDATNFRGLDGEHIRLSTQAPEANSALLNALKNWT